MKGCNVKYNLPLNKYKIFHINNKGIGAYLGCILYEKINQNFRLYINFLNTNHETDGGLFSASSSDPSAGPTTPRFYYINLLD
jgi:hypothetical protein